MTKEMLAGKSIILYRVFAECSGKWATPNWAFGVELGKPRAYKLLQIAWKPATMKTP